MIISFLLIYLVLVFLCKIQNKKNEVNLIIYNNGQLIGQIFFVFYVLGLRLLNFFREIQILDLHNIYISFNILLFFFFFKISYFKVHYVMMCETNFSEKVNRIYKKIYYNIIYFPAFYLLKVFKYLNYLFILFLLIIFFYDIYFNNLILNYCLYFFRYYTFFKLDYYSYNLMYPGNIEKSFFVNFKDFEYQKLKKESERYVSGVIFEKFKYELKTLGNVSEMPYFKNLNR